MECAIKGHSAKGGLTQTDPVHQGLKNLNRATLPQLAPVQMLVT